MRIETRNVTLIGCGQGLLCLHDFQVVRHPSSKAVTSLFQCAIGKIYRYLGDFHLLSGGSKIQQGAANFVIDLAPQVTQLSLRLAEGGFGL